MGADKRINLLAPQVKPPRAATKHAPPGWLRPVLAFVGVVLLGALFIRQLAPNALQDLMNSQAERVRMEKAQERKEALAEQLNAEMDKLTQSRAAATEARERDETVLKLLSASERSKVSVANILADLTTVVPEEIQISKLLFSGAQLTITGVTKDTGSVADLMQRLDASDSFENTKFAYTQLQEQEDDDKKQAAPAYMFEISTTPVDTNNRELPSWRN